jgi:outer membrane receptor protein involved in Fe transport
VIVGAEQNERKTRVAFGYTALGTANLYEGNFADLGTIPGGAANQPFLFDDETDSKNRALYGQVMLSVAERTKLLAGVRYDRARQERRGDRDGGAAADINTDEAHTKRLGVTHDLSEALTVYASYAESFNPVDAVTSSGELLDPETGNAYELGLKGEWLGKRLGASLAVYRQELDNRPIPDPTDPDFSISGGLQRTRGVELEVSGSPYPGFTVGAAAAWFDSKHIDRRDPDYGLRPYGSYDRMASLFTSYEIQGGSWRGLGLGATVFSVGKESLSFGGNGDFYGSGTDELYVDGYERVDLNLYYKELAGWNLSLQVRNIEDRVYIERVRDASGSNYFGSPRAVLFRAERRFE